MCEDRYDDGRQEIPKHPKDMMRRRVRIVSTWGAWGFNSSERRGQGKAGNGGGVVTED